MKILTQKGDVEAVEAGVNILLESDMQGIWKVYAFKEKDSQEKVEIAEFETLEEAEIAQVYAKHRADNYSAEPMIMPEKQSLKVFKDDIVAKKNDDKLKSKIDAAAEYKAMKKK